MVYGLQRGTQLQLQCQYLRMLVVGHRQAWRRAQHLAQHLCLLSHTGPAAALPLGASATSALLQLAGSDGTSSSYNTFNQVHGATTFGFHSSAWAGQSAEPAVDGPNSAGQDAGQAGPLGLYTHRRSAGLYRPDPRQELTVTMLQELWDCLRGGNPRPRKPRGHPSSGLTMVESVAGSSAASSSSHGAHHKHSGKPGARPATTATTRKTGSWWTGVSSLLGGGDDDDAAISTAATPQPGRHIQGLYMFGGVGCGKTMLMDLFVETATPDMQVMRTHFHDFMLSVQQKLRQYKGDTDPLLRVADSIAKGTRVLALDEFFVTDVGNAMILARLFSRLWARGCVLVATSNRHPDKLYEGGLNRQFFLPFIAQLKNECVVHDMASTTDYRRLAQHHRGLYFTSKDRDTELREAWQLDTEGADVTAVELDVVMGRKIQVAEAAGRCALMSFDDLCGKPVAAADYLALQKHFHTLAVSGVPVFNAANRSSGYRFVTLIDIMYESRTRLLISAEAPPLDLFENIVTQSDLQANPGLREEPDIFVDDNLGFAKDRTVSRLTEMQSLEYLVAWAKMHAPENLLALQEAKDKEQ